MANVKLTDSRVQALKPSTTVQRVWDSVISGFHVRVTPAGTKSYCLTLQRPVQEREGQKVAGKKVSVTIGAVNAWTVEDARERAGELLKLHQEGKDIQAHVRAERNAQTVEELVALWEKDYRESLKPSTRTVYDSWIKVVILPALGKRLVRDLDFEAVKKMHREEARRHSISANRAITVLSRLLSIAEKEGWRERGSNPCKGIEKVSEKSRSRVVTAAELASLGGAIDRLVTQKKLDPQAADLFKFLALSGLRRGEAQGLRFADIDLEANTMRFEDHKTAAKSGTKVLPLNSHLREIVQRRTSQRLGPFVFAGRRIDGPIVDVTKRWAQVLVEAKVENVTPHDLRRTFMTTCCELGHPPAIADTLLGHSLGRIRDTYTRLDPNGILAVASQETADWVAAAMASVKVKVGVKVDNVEKFKRNAL